MRTWVLLLFFLAVVLAFAQADRRSLKSEKSDEDTNDKDENPRKRIKAARMNNRGEERSQNDKPLFIKRKNILNGKPKKGPKDDSSKPTNIRRPTCPGTCVEERGDCRGKVLSGRQGRQGCDKGEFCCVKAKPRVKSTDIKRYCGPLDPCTKMTGECRKKKTGCKEGEKRFKNKKKTKYCNKKSCICCVNQCGKTKKKCANLDGTCTLKKGCKKGTFTKNKKYCEGKKCGCCTPHKPPPPPPCKNKKTCTKDGGECQSISVDCDGIWLTKNDKGKKYCKGKNCGCCIPVHNGNECKRECVKGKTMICGYDFTLQDYHTLSRACFECPDVIEDCSRPQCIAADGISRAFLAINREHPGPAIEVCEGDRVIVDVYNGQLSDVETIHWHGQAMKGHQFFDGVPFVTQCPILGHGPFRYNFVAGTVGTAFWHTHSGLHRGDGIFGAFIVRPVEDPQSGLYDHDDHILILQDWFHKTLYSVFLAMVNAAAGHPVVDTILINGKGRNTKAAIEGVPDYPMPLEVVHVTQGQKYRLRIIDSGVTSCPIIVSVDNHRITVIAADTKDIIPTTVDSFVLLPAERFDVVIEANQPIDNYWIRFTGTMTCSKFNCTQGAILRYDGAPDMDPTAVLNYNPNPPGTVLNPFDSVGGDNVLTMMDLDHIEPYTLPDDVDKQFYLEFGFNAVNNSLYYDEKLYPFNGVAAKWQLPSAQINDISFEFPTSPLMSQPDVPQPGVCVHGQDYSDHCQGDFCHCTQVFEVDLNDMVELIVINTYFGLHPFHLHGYSFSVVAMGKVPGYWPMKRLTADVVKALDDAGKITRKLDNAVLKDTVTIAQGGYTIVRFRADNPGYWLMHCHALLHSNDGMIAVLHVGEPSDLPPIPDGFPECKKFKPGHCPIPKA